MRGYLFLLLSITFWALNFHLGKIMLTSVSPNVAAFWRFFFGVLGLLVLVGKAIPPRQIIVKRLPGILLVGFAGVFGFTYFFTQGLDATSEINGALFIALTPAFTLLFATLFQGHQLKLKEVIGLLIAFLGVVFLLTKGNPLALIDISLNIGDLFFLIAAILFSLQNIWIRKFMGDLNGVFFTLMTNTCCLLGFTGLVVMEPGFQLSFPWTLWVAAVGMGVPGTALAYYTWYKGIRDIGPAKGPVFLNGIPVLVAVFSVPFGAELHGYHLISLLILLAGLFIIQWKRVNRIRLY